MLKVLLAIMSFAVAAGESPDPQPIRVAAFNIWELSATKIDQLDGHGIGANRQLRNAAEIIQRVRPDVLLINEIDFDDRQPPAAVRFRDLYLAVSQSGQKPVEFPHVFVAPVNTGLPTGRDLDHDGRTDGPADAIGYGAYPGQYGMALLSRFPIDKEATRTFQRLEWRHMPDHLMPDGTNGKPAWYNEQDAAILRLSSKSHWDVVVRIDDQRLHLLCSHPTPPVFDGPEDRNGRRNFDEIRLWADYLSGGEKAAYIIDDQGRRGGIDADARFVLLGDLNAEPHKGESAYGMTAIDQLLRHSRVQDPQPASPARLAPGEVGPPEHRERHTCDFGRLDYVLPARDLKVIDSGVFWPAESEPLHRLTAGREESSDHRMVWVDLKWPLRK